MVQQSGEQRWWRFLFCLQAFCNANAWNLEETLAAWGAGVSKDKRIEKYSTSWSLTLQCSTLLNEESWEFLYWVLSHHQILLIISCLVSNSILMWLALQGSHFFLVCKALLPHVIISNERRSMVLFHIMQNEKKANEKREISQMKKTVKNKSGLNRTARKFEVAARQHCKALDSMLVFEGR